MADETPSQHARPVAVPRQQLSIPGVDDADPHPADGSPLPGSPATGTSPPVDLTKSARPEIRAPQPDPGPGPDLEPGPAPEADLDPDPEPEPPARRNLLLRGASAAGLGTGRVVHGTGRRIRKATSADGAGESGLAKLIELHALNSFGDMLITIALASTIFFSVPTSEARGRVALYLLVTMAPFALLAPVIGPLLDRLPHGRRAAMAMAMLTRAVLAWTMAGSIADGNLTLYPEALGCLVASKAYGVVRSVVVPRLKPARVTLVKANSRVTLAGLLATGLAAAVGGLLHLAGPSWPLRGAFLVFVIGTLMAFHLPHQVDSAKGEQRAVLHASPHADPQDATAQDGRADAAPRPKGTLRTVGPAVILGLRAVAALRGLSGFLTLFLAFLVRVAPVGGVSPTVGLGLLAVAAGGGNALGSVFGSWLRSRGSEALITAMLLLATAAAAAAAIWYNLVTVLAVAAVAGIAASLAKLALDSLIQRDVPEAVRTSTFARSETLMQLCWVAGGALGILLPLNGTLGLSVAAAILGVALLWTVLALVRLGVRGGAPHPRVA